MVTKACGAKCRRLDVSVAALTVPAGQAGGTAAANSAYAKKGMDSERIKDKPDL